MKNTRKYIRWVLASLLIAYVILCTGYYFFQQYFLMTNTKSSKGVYQFGGKYEEKYIRTKDDKRLHGLLFKADSSKGLIFYLHGGGRPIDHWGRFAKTYTDLSYDIFMLDYRGFGKSEGSLPTEKQLYQDVQDAYDHLKSVYTEDNITVFGYSFGTAPASVLAANNKPRMLILQAPYYNGDAAVKGNYPLVYAIVPSFLLKYKLKTNEYLQRTKVPVVIFHGNKDEVFNISHSYRLKELFKAGDQLVVLDGQGHNGFTENPEYVRKLSRVLSKN